MNRWSEGWSFGVADTYIADLVLRFLNSLQLRRVCDHAETFPFILLKILPVANLQNTNTIMLETKKKVQTCQANNICHILVEMNYTARWTVSMRMYESTRKIQQMLHKWLFIDALT